jgi:hypothetical protein
MPNICGMAFGRRQHNRCNCFMVAKSSVSRLPLCGKLTYYYPKSHRGWLVRIKWGVLVFAISCTATALAMAISGQDDSSADVVGAVEKSRAQAEQQGADAHKLVPSEMHFDLTEIKRTAPDKVHASGLFQSRSWYSPAPSQQIGISSTKSAAGLSAASLSSPPPSAPQLPFIYIGRMIDGDVVTLFLTGNNQLYSAKLNDILDGAYRVDKIAEKSAVLTYLPMNIQQELVFNSTAIGATALNALSPDTAMQPSASTRLHNKVPQ